jgi:hypothetical protein
MRDPHAHSDVLERLKVGFGKHLLGDGIGRRDAFGGDEAAFGLGGRWSRFGRGWRSAFG